jgi:hypothetical protein
MSSSDSVTSSMRRPLPLRCRSEFWEECREKAGDTGDLGLGELPRAVMIRREGGGVEEDDVEGARRLDNVPRGSNGSKTASDALAVELKDSSVSL